MSTVCGRVNAFALLELALECGGLDPVCGPVAAVSCALSSLHLGEYCAMEWTERSGGWLSAYSSAPHAMGCS